MLALREQQGLLLAGQRFLRQRQPLLVRRHRQPVGGHLGHQAQAGAALGLVHGQPALQRLVLQAAHAAEQVQLPAGDAHVQTGGTTGAGITRQAARRGPRPAGLRARAAAHATHRAAALRRMVARGGDGREQAGTLDAVLGPGLLDVQHGHAQVAVVVQCEGDDLPQALVDEQLLPVGHGGHGVIRRGTGRSRPCTAGRTRALAGLRGGHHAIGPAAMMPVLHPLAMTGHLAAAHRICCGRTIPERIRHRRFRALVAGRHAAASGQHGGTGHGHGDGQTGRLLRGRPGGRGFPPEA